MKRSKADLILDAAVQIFAENGYANSTISEIASAAQISDGLIYFYFKHGKLELLLSILIRFWENLIKEINKRTAGIQDPKNKLFIMINLLEKTLFRDKKTIYLGKVIAEQLPTILHIKEDALQTKRKKITELNRRFLSFLDETIKDGQEVGVFEKEINAKLIRQILYGATELIIYGLFLQVYRNENVGYSSAEAQRAIKILIEKFTVTTERG